MGRTLGYDVKQFKKTICKRGCVLHSDETN